MRFIFMFLFYGYCISMMTWDSATETYKGSVNDPTTFPPSKRSHGPYHWTFGLLLSAGIVPLATAAFVTSGSPITLLVGLLGISLIVYPYWGVFSYNPSFIFLLTLPGGSSLTVFWWILFLNTSSRRSVRCSPGRYP